ncbi:MAG TPA: AAA family ATPase [Egibacteraceae bacterium]|nr:AAA family ATPase [Egibacteraceae bacterium]
MRDPLEALDRVRSMTGAMLVVLRDFHEYWEDPQVARRLRNLVQQLRGTGTALLVIGAGARPPAALADEAVPIELPLPDLDELSGVLAEVCEAPKLRRDLTDEQSERLIQAALGLTSSQARRVFTKAIVHNDVLDERDIALVLEEKREIIRSSGILEFHAAAETADDVGGLNALKAWLRLRQRAFGHEAREYGLPAPKGIALIGIPGTGKSLTAKTIGGLWGQPLLRLDVGALFSSMMGESEQRARDALRLAEAIAPCVLWIDELEKALSHGGNDAGTSMRVFATILHWMQERSAPCFVVATANDVSALPPELMRRGRFDEIFFLDLPSITEREEILAVHLRKRGRDPSAFRVAGLAAAAEGYTGAELEQAIADAMYTSFAERRELATEDISRSLRRQVPLSVSQRERVGELRRWLKDGRAVSASSP